MLTNLGRLFRRKSRVVVIKPGKSYHAPDLSLVISSGGVWYVPNPKGDVYRKLKPEFVELVIGAPGLPNLKKELQLGDAVLYQLPDFGVVEIRVVEISVLVKVLITEVSPRRGFSAAYTSEEIENSPFGSDESARIAKDLKKVCAQISDRKDVTPQQLAMLKAKLDEIADASTRLGRKDWIMFSAGRLTNVVVGAAFSPEAAKALFTALNTHLSWVFQNALRLAGS
ncbi:MAG TPA: hypothetical protein VFF26_02015 [Gallionella sp.]|nr:hypothetical protein [Gallionella sp.]